MSVHEEVASDGRAEMLLVAKHTDVGLFVPLLMRYLILDTGLIKITQCLVLRAFSRLPLTVLIMESCVPLLFIQSFI